MIIIRYQTRPEFPVKQQILKVLVPTSYGSGVTKCCIKTGKTLGQYVISAGK